MESAKRPQKHAPNYNLWTVERLLRNSHDEPSGCRVWDGSLNKPGGYGRISYMGKGWRTHRLAYLVLHQPEPFTARHTRRKHQGSLHQGAKNNATRAIASAILTDA